MSVTFADDDMRPSDSHIGRMFDLMSMLYPVIDSVDMALTETVLATLVFNLPDNDDVMTTVTDAIANATRRLR